MKIAQTLTELVGNTPLLALNNYSVKRGLLAPIVAKIESFNPGGSAKDRVALSMIDDAERKGLIKPGAKIIEPTSGNTGVGLALVAAVRGYRLVLTMPETMSVERRKLVQAYGAEVVLTPAEEGMAGSIRVAEQLRDSNSGSIILQQFENPSNPAAHYATTGQEIYAQTDGKVDVFVAGIGTGGTISGTGRALKERNPEVKIVGVEPANSALLHGKPAGQHNLQGIGANFIPKTYDADVVDEVIDVTDEAAISTARQLAKEEGLLVGITSGAAVYAALTLAKRKENEGKTIVALLPDTGERYLSTALYDFDGYPC